MYGVDGLQGAKAHVGITSSKVKDAQDFASNHSSHVRTGKKRKSATVKSYNRRLQSSTKYRTLKLETFDFRHVNPHRT